MTIPIPAVYVKTAPTFFKAIRGHAATVFNTNSNTYVDITNINSISSVPNNAKLMWAMNFLKVTAGNGFMRITDGTTTFKEVSEVFGTTYTIPEFDGTVLQSSGGAATVKLQAKSDDANNIQVSPNSNFFLATDGDTPNVTAGPLISTTLRIPWKVSIEKIYLYYGSNLISTTDLAIFNGLLAFEETSVDGNVKNSELTFTYPNEQVSQYMEFNFENNPVANQYMIWDWSGHGVAFA